MTDQNLDDIFREAAALTEPQPDSRRTPECLPLPRFRALALDPTRWTEREWRHVHRSSCRRCSSAVELTAAEPPWHPSVAELLSTSFGFVAPSDEMRQHLEVDTCRRCLGIANLTRTDWRERLKVVLAARKEPGLGVLACEHVTATPRFNWLRLVPVVLPLAIPLFRRKRRPSSEAESTSVSQRLLAPISPITLRPQGFGQDFEEASEHPLHVQFQVGEEGEPTGTATLEEKGGGLVLTLQTREPELAGVEVSFTVVGAEGELITQGAFQMSQPAFEGWITGSAKIGASSLRKKLGQSPSVLFFL